MNDLTTTKLENVPDRQIKSIITEAVETGATFVKYEFFSMRLFMIVPRTSALYKSKQGVKGLSEVLNKLVKGVKLTVKII